MDDLDIQIINLGTLEEQVGLFAVDAYFSSTDQWVPSWVNVSTEEQAQKLAEWADKKCEGCFEHRVRQQLVGEK